ncbi:MULTISPECIES: hypothetical protein [Kitasatospora]|uniref:2'-5' RNA ligase n=1 Tax=Kitasatospora setae (strain ATCC 33774 / DSM 43861 / JCM 3304 / KCC A-0304 / NBRC 14216 / KM-6054) TaxID=452652 RepID=E4N9N3_KITSK|nr:MULTISPECIES: hypothetical protein [Kitasatospora]BAJ27914.1 hypothetical protein KSE_20910 [Kitasatospora setae KM-6054]
MTAAAASPQTGSDPLAEVYRELWRDGERALREASHQADGIPVHGSPRWGLSLVVRVDGAPGEALAAELAALAGLRSAPHLVYRPEHLHLTVRSVEGFADEVGERSVTHYADQARAAVQGLSGLAVTLRGLGGSPGGLFACGYPTPALRELRTRLHAAARSAGRPGVPGGDADRIRNTAHASLVVYRPPIVPEPALADHVAARAGTEFGTLAVTALSLVRYRPTATDVALEELARIGVPR